MPSGDLVLFLRYPKCSSPNKICFRRRPPSRQKSIIKNVGNSFPAPGRAVPVMAKAEIQLVSLSFWARDRNHYDNRGSRVYVIYFRQAKKRRLLLKRNRLLCPFYHSRPHFYFMSHLFLPNSWYSHFSNKKACTLQLAQSSHFNSISITSWVQMSTIEGAKAWNMALHLWWM